MYKRVVITGMGVVSPIGCGLDNFWNGIKTGPSVKRILLCLGGYFPTAP